MSEDVFDKNRPSHIPQDLILNFLKPFERSIPGENRPVKSSIFSRDIENRVITHVLQATDYGEAKDDKYAFLLKIRNPNPKIEALLPQYLDPLKDRNKQEMYLIVTDHAKQKIISSNTTGVEVRTKVPSIHKPFLQGIMYLTGEKESIDSHYEAQGRPGRLDFSVCPPLKRDDSTGDIREWQPDQSHKYALDFKYGMEGAIEDILKLIDEASINLPLSQGAHFNEANLRENGFEKRSRELVDRVRTNLKRFRRRDSGSGDEYYSTRDTVRVIGMDDGYSYALKVYSDSVEYFSGLNR